MTDVVTKQAQATVTSDDTGAFDVVLSSSALDREGEVLLPGDWQQPLPSVIPINVNHSKSVRDVVGSGRPFIDANGNLRVKGVFASNPEAQHVRSLVSEGHLRSVSVEFLRRKSADGQPVNELIGGAFVLVPANPEAIVLSAKDFSDRLELVVKAAADGGDAAMVQAIHDAAGHLGAQCVGMSEDGVDGAEDGANKCAALALRLKALAR